MPYRSKKAELPCHIHASEAPATLCGIKMNSEARFPYCGAHAVQMHIDGCDPLWCGACLDAWEAAAHWKSVSR